MKNKLKASGMGRSMPGENIFDESRIIYCINRIGKPDVELI